MSGAKSWNCPTCNREVTTPFCAECGERPLVARDLTLRGLFAQLFHALSSIDGRVIRSLRCLVNRPGALTLAYVQGRRVAWISPFQLFLITNVLFFATQSLTGANIVGVTIDSHLNGQDWSELAQTLVENRMEALQTTVASYAPVFNQAIVLNAKTLIILMVVPFALLLPLVFYGTRQPFATHVTFSLHFYAFLLLLFCVSLAVSAVDVLRGGAGLESARLDNILSVINFAAAAIYLYIAAGAVYGTRRAMRVVRVLALTAGTAVIFLGYRFLLFLITLYSTP
jgi:hypothetical protein